MSIPSARADGAAEPVAYAAFLKAHPEYDRTNAVNTLRASDYRRLDAGRHVYLDYTGGGLHAESQVRDHGDLLNRHVFGNPHSANLTSSGMTTLVEQGRHYREAACVVGPLIAPYDNELGIGF